jgi:hypothetical protein
MILEKNRISINPLILEENFNDEIATVFRKNTRIYLDICHGKFDHYYKFLNEISVYAAAIVFNFTKR